MPRWFTPSILLLAMAVAGALGPAIHTGKAAETGLQRKASPATDLCSRTQLPRELFGRTDLFFGSAKLDSSAVTEDEFRLFLEQQVTPRFPDGLTLFVGLGQFRDVSGVITLERSMMLILLYPLGQTASHNNIEHIRETYKAAFQ